MLLMLLFSIIFFMAGRKEKHKLTTMENEYEAKLNLNKSMGIDSQDLIKEIIKNIDKQTTNVFVANFVAAVFLLMAVYGLLTFPK